MVRFFCYQGGIDVWLIEVLSVYDVRFIVLESAFLVVCVGKVQQSVVRHWTANRSFINAGHFFCQCFRRRQVLKQKKKNNRKFPFLYIRRTFHHLPLCLKGFW